MRLRGRLCFQTLSWSWKNIPKLDYKKPRTHEQLSCLNQNSVAVGLKIRTEKTVPIHYNLHQNLDPTQNLVVDGNTTQSACSILYAM